MLAVDGAARAIGRVQPIVVPAVELAIVTHRGSHADIDITYGALAAHVSAHELSVDGRCARSTYAAPTTLRTPGNG